MTVPLVWVSYHPEVNARAQWDCGLLENLFNRSMWTPVLARRFSHRTGFDQVGDGAGAVVVVPAQHHVDDVDRLNRDLERLRWCVVMLIGDEHSLFPWHELSHPAMRLWIMTPRPSVHTHGVGRRFIGEGYGPSDTPGVLAQFAPAVERQRDFFFAGQVTHERRRSCVEALRALHHDDDWLVETPGFLQGLARLEYLGYMSTAKVVPAPSGPGTPDSFRAYEALEAGALPLVDATTSEGWAGYWWFLLGKQDPPFPVVKDWADLPDIMADAVAGWPANANRASAWWQRYKRDLAYNLEEDLSALGAPVPRPDGPSDAITVLIPTSPIPSHPDTTMIEETLASLRAQPDLAGCEMIVMIDGVRPEQEARRDDYEEYVRRLLLVCNRMPNVVPLRSETHLHQAGMTRLALEMVKTPCVAFVEHDTPVDGYIPWDAMARAIVMGKASVIRLHHEAAPLEAHRHLMVDAEAHFVDGIPMMRCAQWSQRPHLSSTDFYRWMISTYFGHQSRTMIEDVMHGVIDQAWREDGVEGWEPFGLYLYTPEGDIRRTRHSDGRGSEEKYENLFEYDGPQPAGAPRSTSERRDLGLN